mgnify:CR=1 FL=1
MPEPADTVTEAQSPFTVNSRSSPAPVQPQADWAFNLIYSSGTTGVPKGILQPWSMRWAQIQRGRSNGYDAHTVNLVATPLYSNTTLVTWDEKNGLVKVNPVAAWTFDELNEYAAEHKVPMNLLLDHGYPSIGCAPCTRAVRAHEDLRAGRWWWLSNDSKECGLHQ